MALFAATASRLHPIRHPVTLSPQTKKASNYYASTPLNFPHKILYKNTVLGARYPSNCTTSSP